MCFHEVTFDKKGKPVFPASGNSYYPKKKPARESISNDSEKCEPCEPQRNTQNSPKDDNHTAENPSTEISSSQNEFSKDYSPKIKRAKYRTLGFSPRVSPRISPYRRGFLCKRDLGYEFRSSKFKTNPCKQTDWLLVAKKFCVKENLVFYEQKYDSSARYGVITQKEITNDFFPVKDKSTIFSPVRIIIEENGAYTVEVLYKQISKDKFFSNKDVSQILTHYLKPREGDLVFCRGVDPERFSRVGYSLKNVRQWNEPFKRIDSKKCDLYHKPHNQKVKKGSLLYNVCNSCKKLDRQIENSLKTKRLDKSDRSSISSKCNWRFVSPKSRKKREIGFSTAKIKMKRQLKKLKVSKCSLNESQGKEMCKIVTLIEKGYKKELNEVIEDAARGEHEKKQLLTTLWKQDLKDRKEFFNDQVENSKCYFVPLMP